MKKTQVLIGTTAILALAFLGSSCEKKSETNMESSMKDDSMNMVNDSAMEENNDSMENEESMVEGTATYSVNTSESNLHWLAKKVGGQHQGDIKVSAGSLEVEDGVPVSGTFTIDMTSMVLTDEPANEGLMNHLRGDDFFSVDQYPTAEFELTSATSQGGEDYLIEGNLTIKGITEPVSFPAKISSDGDMLTATGTVEVDRTAYDIKFRSLKFFDDIADKAIEDTFTLDLDLVASAQ